MVTLDQEIASMLRDFGVTVVSGAVTALGHFDHVTRAEGFGQELADVLVMEPSVLVRAADFTSLRVGDAITVDGTAYTVRDRKAMADGRTLRLFLRVAP